MSSLKPLQMGIPSTMGDDVQLTLKYLFDRGLTVQPNVEIITRLDDGGYHTIRYRQLTALVNTLASSLSSVCDVQCGDIVATFMWNTSRHMTIFHAVPNMGAAVLPLNIRLHPSELAYIIQHAQPKVVIIDAVNLPLFEKISPSALQCVQHFIIAGHNMQSSNWHCSELSKLSHADIMDYDVLLSNGNVHFDGWPNLDEKSGAFLFYTSGTTGNPKGILWSHRATSLKVLCFLQFAFKGDDCVLALPPMFHVGGWTVTYCALTLGFKVLYPNNCYDFTQLLNWSVQQGANVMFGVPTMIRGIAEALKSNPRKFERFRGNLRFLTGGSAIPIHVVSWLWNEWQIDVLHAFGMTESIGTLSQRLYRRSDLEKTEDERTQNMVTQGTFLPLVHAKLVHPENAEQSVAKNGKDFGEVLLRGPCTTSSYFKGASPASFVDGWLRTGDIAVISAENEMKITDRSKDLIKSGGEWISSVDLENHVMKMEEVELACVVGVYHPKWDERPIVIVKTANGRTVSKEKVLEHIAAKYARFQRPDDVLFWKDIPLTGTGKLSKRTVRDMLKRQKYKLPTFSGSIAKL